MYSYKYKMLSASRDFVPWTTGKELCWGQMKIVKEFFRHYFILISSICSHLQVTWSLWIPEQGLFVWTPLRQAPRPFFRLALPRLLKFFQVILYLFDHSGPRSSPTISAPLSWRLEFFELLTQSTRGCPRTGSLSLSLNTGKTQLIWLQWYEAQSCQERNGSTLQSASIPDRTYIREEFWFHYRSRVKHEGPYHQTLPVVLPPASSNTHGSTLTYIISHPNFGPCLHLHASQFLQQPSQGPTSLTVSNRS